MSAPLGYPIFKGWTLAGTPAAGYKVYTYLAGTSTPLASYTTSALSVANPNPVILDANGEAQIWLGSQSYKIVLATDLDVVVWTIDNVSGVIGSGSGGGSSTGSVLTFNTRTGDVTLTFADVFAALGYTPMNKAGDSMSGPLAMGGQSIGGVEQFSFNAVFDAGTSGTAKTIDFAVNGNYQKLSMTGACVLTFSAPSGPCVVHLEMTQDGTGSRVMTLPATVKWPGSYAAADKLLSTAVSARDLLILKYNGTDYVANLIKAIA
jgi:hypothetical protein